MARENLDSINGYKVVATRTGKFSWYTWKSLNVHKNKDTASLLTSPTEKIKGLDIRNCVLYFLWNASYYDKNTQRAKMITLYHLGLLFFLMYLKERRKNS